MRFVYDINTHNSLNTSTHPKNASLAKKEGNKLKGSAYFQSQEQWFECTVIGSDPISNGIYVTQCKAGRC